MRWFFLLLLTGLLAACTTDDPGPKSCEPGSDDPDQQCISGYTCECKPEGCTCVKSSGLTRAPAPAPFIAPRSDDPYLRLLERIGAFERP